MRASCGRVDVWEVSLEPGGCGTPGSVLSEPERVFAARLRVGAAAWRVARAALRRVLGSYLEIPPGRVALEHGPNDKPRLAPGTDPDLRFNLSHSGAVALVAVRLGHEVGIDVEQVRGGVDGEAIAREVFEAADRVSMAELSAIDPRGAFFRTWARREALAKATGAGIASMASPDATAGITVRELPGLAGHVAAVASEGRDWTVRWIIPSWQPRARRSHGLPAVVPAA